MASEPGSGTAELRTPVFNGENYEFWSIRMKTILKSHGLWDLVENGFDVSDPKQGKEEEEGSKVAEVEKSTKAEILMKDARCHTPDRLRRSTILSALGLATLSPARTVLFLGAHEATSQGGHPSWDCSSLQLA
ncbi:hypothetical protein L3X38_009644 [Prunus dulcis]|uniref:DUF4219 domain-containing protein n=1 Tax=Prunus dulcis TaxID=3755 RepID=A0AAD4ZDH7_PRUDU|nr:hypothetical protein L3X38_009644 [Prunus dulcis]